MTDKIKSGHRFLILLTVLNLAVILLLPNSFTRLALSDFLYLLLNLCVLICLLLAARAARSVSPLLAACWWLLLASHLLDLIADSLWVYYEVVLHIDPFPSLADLFYIASYPVYLAGILMLVEKGGSRTRQVNTWLDAILVFASSFLFLWVLLLHPLLQSMTAEPSLNQMLNMAYPIGDLLLIIALLVLIYKRSPDTPSTPLLFLAASLLVQIVSDLFFSYQSITDSYISGGWVDIGWVVSYALLGTAAYYQATQKPATIQRPIVDSFWRKALLSYRDLLPYVIAIAALLFAQISYSSGLYNTRPFLLVNAWIIALLVFTRQYLSLRENNQLNQNLQSALLEVKESAAAEKQLNTRLLMEIRQRKKYQKQLQHSALHDPLTGLPNRTLFLDRLEHALAYARRHSDYFFAVFFIDLDHFKQVNDHFGHACGDEALTLLAQKLQKALRHSDTLARLGGDEFAVLVEDSPTEESLRLVADRILEGACMTFKKNSKTISISASIGLVCNCRGYQNVIEILNDADTAMYRAKVDSNENLVVFEPGMRRQEENPKLPAIDQSVGRLN